MKKKTSTRIIALLLCVITIVSVVAGAIATSSTRGTQASILDVFKSKTRVTQAQVEKAVDNNVNKDYTLKSMIDSMGYPGAVMINYDGVNVFNYAEEDDVKYLLENYKEDARFSADSILQLMWMDESDNLVFTFLATEYNTPTVVGVVVQTLKDIVAKKDYIPDTTSTLKDFDKYDEETLKTLGEAFTSSIQYPLLDCNYTKKHISSSNLNAVWTTKLVENEQGLMYIVLQDGKPYQLYQDYDSKKLPTYDKSENLWTGLNERQFLNEYPDAVRIQLFNHVENETDYFIISYAVNEKDKNGDVKEAVYNIVGGDLYVYDDKGELATNNNGLIIEGGNGNASSTETVPAESTEPTTALDATESP